MIDRHTLEQVLVIYVFFVLFPVMAFFIAVFNRLAALQKQIDLGIKKYPNERLR